MVFNGCPEITSFILDEYEELVIVVRIKVIPCGHNDIVQSVPVDIPDSHRFRIGANVENLQALEGAPERRVHTDTCQVIVYNTAPRTPGHVVIDTVVDNKTELVFTINIRDKCGCGAVWIRENRLASGRYLDCPR